VIVLDTHAWIWWLSAPKKLGREAKRQIESARSVGVPAVCCFETAFLRARGRITLDRPTLDWIHSALATPRVVLLPLIPEIAIRAAELPTAFPGDPADRLIAATALAESAVLITKDGRITDSGVVRTAW